MPSSPSAPTSKDSLKPSAAAKKERLAKALKANLARRKQPSKKPG
jgi:hypothetical protein